MQITGGELKTLDMLLKKTGRTLQLSAKVFPRRDKIIFSTAYLLCRAADTVADTDIISREKKIFWVKKFPSFLDAEDAALLLEEASSGAGNPAEKELLQNLPLVINIYKRLEADDKKNIRAIVEKVCEGMLFDLGTFTPGRLTALESAAQLEYYCATMGGAPGIFWSELILKGSVIKTAEKKFIRDGKSIGDALQIVNVIRDVKEDILNDRCYFPSEDLKFFNASTEDFKNGKPSARPVVLKWILWGLDKISRAPEYYAAIPKIKWRYRLSVLLPAAWTLDTFLLLAKSDVTGEKVKIKKKNIYLTFLKSPLYLLSNRAFAGLVDRRINKIKEALTD